MAGRRSGWRLVRLFFLGLYGAANAAFAVWAFGAAGYQSYRLNLDDLAAGNPVALREVWKIALTMAAALPAVAGAVAGCWIVWRAESPATAKWRRWIAVIWLVTALLAVAGWCAETVRAPALFRPDPTRTVPALIVCIALGLGLLPLWWLASDAWRRRPRALRGRAGWACAAAALVGIALLCLPIARRWKAMRRLEAAGAFLGPPNGAFSTALGTVGMAIFRDANVIRVPHFDAQAAADLAGFDAAQYIEFGVKDAPAAWRWLQLQREPILGLELTGGDFSFVAPADIARSGHAYAVSMTKGTWRFDTLATMTNQAWGSLKLNDVRWAPGSATIDWVLPVLHAASTPPPPMLAGRLAVQYLAVSDGDFRGWVRALANAPPALPVCHTVGLKQERFVVADAEAIIALGPSVQIVQLAAAAVEPLALRALARCPALKKLEFHSAALLLDPSLRRELQALRKRKVEVQVGGVSMSDE